MIKLFSSILLGFLRNPKLGSAISNDYVISRMVTYVADNLVTLSLTAQAPTRIA